MTDERDDADSGQLASAAARLGKRGGMVRAKVLPTRLRSRIAAKGAEARWGKTTTRGEKHLGSEKGKQARGRKV